MATKALATPVDLKALMEKAAAAAKAKEAADSNFISFKSGIISFNEQQAKDNKVQVIVLHSAFENNYYPNAYDPGKVVSPDCWAVGTDEDALVGSKHGACKDCEFNQWGSATSGAKNPDGTFKGKACKNVRRLGMIQASQLNDEHPDLLFAKLPVTSVANWSKYVNQIGNVVKRPPWGVVTEMSACPDAKSQFKVNFQFMGLVPDESLEAMMELEAATAESSLFGYPENQ